MLFIKIDAEKLSFHVRHRDVVPTKKMWERIQKIAILRQLPTHFKAKREKGVGMLLPHFPAPLHPSLGD